MIEATNAERLSVLKQMGISWYVPTDFNSDGFTVEAGAVLPHESIEPRHDVPLIPQPVSTPIATATTSAILAELVIDQPKPPKEAFLAPDVEAVAPFHWLIAKAGFVNFICDIKQERLPPVWHAAAQELLGDIAIALGANDRLNSQYFSWPPSGVNAALVDADLPDFLSEYLDGDGDNALFVLMGHSAQLHASALVLKGSPSVTSVALGQLFRDHQHKKSLWQQLKPLRR